VAIAFLGDSITLGAEAGPWWNDRSQTYTGLVLAGLRERYPAAGIREIAAYRGGITTTQGSAFFRAQVQPANPNLLLIALGINDAYSSDRAPPTTPPAAFKAAIRAMIVAARAAGTEVMLVTPLVPYNHIGERRIGAYRRALLELAAEENVACADVQRAWTDLTHRGIPPFSQLHNCSNHPGTFGMTVYADTILRFFETPGRSRVASRLPRAADRFAEQR
jgi:lysophospholipase L1-like esterase